MLKPLSGMRILICGKGGSGKSTLVTLVANVLRDKGYKVHVLDGDPSNPGLYRMLGFKEAPETLIEYFGGKEFTGGKVTCPVDDPKPLPGAEISLDELPAEYYVEKNGITFFRSGKIKRAYEGCDGPEDKVTRDFWVLGSHVTLIDIKAGYEHFGRGVEVKMDGVITVVDPTSTSFDIAEEVKEMVDQMNRKIAPATHHLDSEDAEIYERVTQAVQRKFVYAILNKVRSEEIESIMTKELKKRGMEPIGSVRDDPEIFKSCLEGTPLKESGAKKDIEEIVNHLEGLVEE